MPATIELPSTIEGVTVHRRDAFVRRGADVGGIEVPTVAKIGPLPLSIHPGSVRAVVLDASGALAPQAATVRVGVEPVGHSRDDGRRAPELQALDDAQHTLDIATSEVDRLQRDIDAITSRLVPLPRLRAKTGDGDLVRRDREPVAVEQRLALLTFRTQQLDVLTSALPAAQRARREAARAYEEARDRWMAAQPAESREHELVAAAFVALQGAGRVPSGSRLELSYLAAGATWRPSHRLFANGTASRLSLGAVVTQRTGEDWPGVELDLATTDPALQWQVPELKPLRIGRAAPPAARGWQAPRPLPAELFADFDRAQHVAQDDARRAGPTAGSGVEVPTPTAEWMGDQGPVTAEVPIVPPAAPEIEQTYAALPPPVQSMPPPPAGPAPPMPQALMASTRSAPKGGLRRSRQASAPAAPAPVAPAAPAARGGSDMAVSASLALPSEVDPDRPDASVADLDRLVLPGPDEHDRGRPRPHAPAVADADRHTARARARTIEQLHADGFGPLTAHAPGTDGLACVYRVGSLVDLASSRSSSTVVIAEAATTVREEFVTVPYEAPEVFRTLVFANALAVPVVAGPVEVSGPTGAIAPAELPTITPGAEAHIGVGIEDGIRVERQVDHRDDAKGLVRSSRVLEHDVTIRLTNRLGDAASVIVRERVPTVPETEDRASVEELSVEPPWQPYRRADAILRGGRQWTVTVEPAQVTELRARWQITIPAKFELDGGNRR